MYITGEIKRPRTIQIRKEKGSVKYNRDMYMVQRKLALNPCLCFPNIIEQGCILCN